MMRRFLVALGLALALAVPVPAEDFQGQADLEQRQMHGRPEDAADPEGAALRADMEAGVVPGAALAKRVAGAYAFDKDAGATRELSRIMYGQDGRPPPSIGTLVGLARALTGEKYGKYAETAVRRALALDPGNPGAYRELARILADRGAWEAAAESRGFRSGFLAVEPGEDPLRPRPVEITLDGLHRAEIVVRLLAPPGETLLFLDGACEGEGEPAGEGREWRAEALLGRRVVELWDGDRLRMREALDLEEAGGAAVLEVDGGGLVLLRRVPFEPPRVRRCRFPAGEEVPPPD
ncbi:MAG: hypothetical protein HUU06_11020 [Planctomycetaceae bacterium]|nr:hypothetical protein [Planctomycetaceae bacterium]